MGTGVRRKPDWSDLRVFYVVAQEGGLQAAARALGVNVSTVNRALEALEERLNASLFVRGPRGVTLTEAGVKAYDRVLSMERMAQALELEVGDAESTESGRVKLAAPDGLAGFFLTPHIHEFLRAWPEIDLTIDCGLWPDRPLDGEVDLTLTYVEPTQPDAVARPIATIHYALFASRAYLDLFGEPADVESALKHPFIHHVAQDHQKEKWSERAKAVQTLTNRRITTNSSAVVMQAVTAGAGIAALPTAVLEVAPELVMLEIKPLAPAKLWLVHHREATRSVRVQRTIEWLKVIFDARAKPWYRAEFVHPRDFGQALPRSLPRDIAEPERAETLAYSPPIKH